MHLIIVPGQEPRFQDIIRIDSWIGSPMQRSLKFEINPATLLVLIIGAAAVLRGYNLMHGSGAHPDERHIIMVTSGFSWSNLNPKSFAYGSLPFYLVWFCAQLLQLFGYQANYDHLFVVGRSLAVIFGVCAVYLTYRIALKLFEKHSIALLAAAFLAFNPFHLQLSRFCTVDIFLTTFALACISALIDFAKAGRIRDAMFAALFFGLSLGTKISALSLLVPLITALLAAKAKRPEKSGIGLFALLSLILPISLLICFLVQPYAFWDWQVFMAHTNEQINMVRGNWRPPYTIQYLGTLPYLYPLEQIFKYTMGWPVALICCAGVLLSLFRILQRPLWPTLLKLEAIPLGWLFAVYISVGGMDVKFPRYLLPLYPLLCIFGAQLLIEMSSKLRPALLRPIPALLVTVHAVIFGLAFVTIYRPDHAYTKASEWVFANVPAGARLLGVHWDDKLPVTLPGHDAQQYQMWSPENELPLYEHDTAQKMRMVAERMAASDYLIFPTARTYGSIPKMPESFPATIYFLKLLFAEKLGYKLVYTLREQPSFGSFVFPDDLADESISVYDHPRVTVFKNEARMSADQILAAVRPMTDSPELPGLREMLLHTAPPTFGHEEFLLNQGWYQLLQFLAWFAVIQLLGLAAFPFVAMCLPKNRDGGYGYSKIIGLGVFGILAAALNLTGVLQLKLIHLWALLLILMLGSHLFVLGYFRSWGALVASRRKFIIGNEISFCCAFLVFTILRIFNPEIFWGEKPMDFGMLNYFLRLEDLPPKDPWAAQQPLNYYYLGILLSAIIHKLSGVSSAIGYHLSLVTIFAFYLSAAYSIIIFL
ncbi:MAG: hypothetical protein DCC75_09030, partial [Proteobacteria bacterium]